MCAARGLAAHGRRFAQAQKNHIRLRAALERARYAGQILRIDVDSGCMQHLRLGQRAAQSGEHARHGHPFRPRPPRAAHLARRRPAGRSERRACPRVTAGRRGHSSASPPARAPTARASRRRAATVSAPSPARRPCGTDRRTARAFHLRAQPPAAPPPHPMSAELTQPRSSAIGKPWRKALAIMSMSTPAFSASRRRLRKISGDAVIDGFAHGVVVAHDDAFESQPAAQPSLEQRGVRRHGDARQDR